MVGKLFFHIISGILGLYLAVRIVPEVYFMGTYKMLLIIGGILGLINCFIKPIIKAISLPVRIITLGIFGLIINMAMIWLVEILFPKDLEIRGLIPLFWTTAIIWLLNFFFGLYNQNRKRKQRKIT